ncbi:MAG: hypothetical protein E7365_01050 [Clostridiales bacterium]|nr:hypothetical protein [Clostridiales bacterium]
MYKFKQTSLYFDNKVILKNINPWVNTRLEPWEPKKDCKIFLNLKQSDEQSLYFESENGAANLTVTLKQEDNSFALYLSGGYNAEGIMGFGTHLNALKNLGFDFGINYKGNYVSGFMDYLFWQRPHISSKLSTLKDRTQVILYKNNENKTYLNSVCDDMFKTEFFYAKNNRISLAVCSNTLCDSINECVLIGSYGKDEYSLPEKAVGFGLKVMQKQGVLRKHKKYPEDLEYLGWCSWDAFQCDVTSKNLLEKAQEFKDKDIPVRWMILDDTWCDVSCISIKTMHSRELNDWEAPKKRFPDGLKKAINDVKDQYGLKVGIWHPISGYWYGINPDGPLAKRYPELFEHTIPGMYPDGTRLMHSFEKNKITKYYDLQYKFYKDCGADFVKVDNQGSTIQFSYFKGGIGKVTKNLHNAIEKATKKYFNKEIINCMGMPVENFWNRTYSNVNRFSGDFLPEDRNWFVDHILQCSYNSISQGTVYTGDWDMFWSDDDQAKKNAVLRALSGGPIYVSDKLDRSIKEVIMPLAFSDGRILRLENHPLITKDCLFEDARSNGKIFKIFNTYKGAGMLAAFNLDKKEQQVQGTVSAKDISGLKQGKYVVYNWFTGENFVVDYEENTDLMLKNYDDFRLLIFTKITNGKAILGLKEKYIMPKTFKTVKGETEVFDNGTLLVYSEKDVPGFEKVEENIYSKKVVKGEKIII